MPDESPFAIAALIFVACAVVIMSTVGFVVIISPHLRVVDISQSQIIVDTNNVNEFRVYSAVRRYNIK